MGAAQPKFKTEMPLNNVQGHFYLYIKKSSNKDPKSSQIIKFANQAVCQSNTGNFNASSARPF